MTPNREPSPSKLPHPAFNIWSYWDGDIDKWMWSWWCDCGEGKFPFVTAVEAMDSVRKHAAATPITESEPVRDQERAQ